MISTFNNVTNKAALKLYKRTYEEQLEWELQKINAWLEANDIKILRSVDLAPDNSGCKITIRSNSDYGNW